MLLTFRGLPFTDGVDLANGRWFHEQFIMKLIVTAVDCYILRACRAVSTVDMFVMY